MDERPADPRVLRSREAILAAVAAILEDEGPAGVTHQRVAERAGVGRATVYRHWPQPVDLLADGLGQVEFHFLDPAPGPLRDRLCEELYRLAGVLEAPLMRAMIGSLMQPADSHDAAQRHRDRVKATVVANLAAAVELAVQAGELRRTPDIEELAAQLLGPLFYRRMIQDRSVDAKFVEHVVDAALSDAQRSGRR